MERWVGTAPGVARRSPLGTSLTTRNGPQTLFVEADAKSLLD